MKIPKRLISFWHRKSELPTPMAGAVQSTVGCNPGFEVLFADDAYMDEHIAQNYPADVLALYRENRIPASRSDMARMMLLYHFGGFYVDTSMSFSTSFESMISDAAELVIVKRDDFPQYVGRPEDAHITNNIVGAVKACPMIGECISIILDNLKTRRYNNDVWHATGPHCLNLLISKFDDVTTVQKLRFTELVDKHFSYRRVEGVSNAWVEQQREGIFRSE